MKAGCSALSNQASQHCSYEKALLEKVGAHGGRDTILEEESRSSTSVIDRL
jgi:hypothetical protein